MTFDRALQFIAGWEGQLTKAIERALDAEARHAELRVLTPDPANSRGIECAHDGCARVAYAGGLCNAHYIRRRESRDMDRPLRATRQGKNCVECGAPKGGKGGWGLCARHYKRKRRVAIKTAVVAALGGRCSACEGVFPLAAYDLHHPGTEKEVHPSLVMVNSSVELIAREVAKCVLLCANCHRAEHASDEL